MNNPNSWFDEIELYLVKQLIYLDCPLDNHQLTAVIHHIKSDKIKKVELRSMIEKAYRRGFVHGANETHHAAFVDSHSDIDIRDWIDNDLHVKWRVKKSCRKVVYPPIL